MKKIKIYSEIDKRARLKKFLFHDNYYISKDTVIAVIETEYGDYKIKSPVEGYVLKHAKLGKVLKKRTPIACIGKNKLKEKVSRRQRKINKMNNNVDLFNSWKSLDYNAKNNDLDEMNDINITKESDKLKKETKNKKPTKEKILFDLSNARNEIQRIKSKELSRTKIFEENKKLMQENQNKYLDNKAKINETFSDLSNKFKARRDEISINKIVVKDSKPVSSLSSIDSSTGKPNTLRNIVSARMQKMMANNGNIVLEKDFDDPTDDYIDDSKNKNFYSFTSHNVYENNVKQIKNSMNNFKNSVYSKRYRPLNSYSNESIIQEKLNNNKNVKKYEEKNIDNNIDNKFKIIPSYTNNNLNNIPFTTNNYHINQNNYKNNTNNNKDDLIEKYNNKTDELIKKMKSNTPQQQIKYTNNHSNEINTILLKQQSNYFDLTNKINDINLKMDMQSNFNSHNDLINKLHNLELKITSNNLKNDNKNNLQNATQQSINNPSLNPNNDPNNISIELIKTLQVMINNSNNNKNNIELIKEISNLIVNNSVNNKSHNEIQQQLPSTQQPSYIIQNLINTKVNNDKDKQSEEIKFNNLNTHKNETSIPSSSLINLNNKNIVPSEPQPIFSNNNINAKNDIFPKENIKHYYNEILNNEINNNNKYNLSNNNNNYKISSKKTIDIIIDEREKPLDISKINKKELEKITNEIEKENKTFFEEKEINKKELEKIENEIESLNKDINIEKIYSNANFNKNKTTKNIISKTPSFIPSSNKAHDLIKELNNELSKQNINLDSLSNDKLEKIQNDIAIKNKDVDVAKIYKLDVLKNNKNSKSLTESIPVHEDIEVDNFEQSKNVINKFLLDDANNLVRQFKNVPIENKNKSKIETNDLDYDKQNLLKELQDIKNEIEAKNKNIDLEKIYRSKNNFPNNSLNSNIKLDDSFQNKKEYQKQELDDSNIKVLLNKLNEIQEELKIQKQINQNNNLSNKTENFNSHPITSNENEFKTKNQLSTTEEINLNDDNWLNEIEEFNPNQNSNNNYEENDVDLDFDINLESTTPGIIEKFSENTIEIPKYFDSLNVEQVNNEIMTNEEEIKYDNFKSEILKTNPKLSSGLEILNKDSNREIFVNKTNNKNFLIEDNSKEEELITLNEKIHDRKIILPPKEKIIIEKEKSYDSRTPRKEKQKNFIAQDKQLILNYSKNAKLIEVNEIDNEVKKFNKWIKTNTEPIIRNTEIKFDNSLDDMNNVNYKTIKTNYINSHLQMTNLLKLQNRFKKANSYLGLDSSLISFIVKAISIAVTKVPEINVMTNALSKDFIQKTVHNVGITAETPLGIVVPVVRFVNKMNLRQAIANTQELIERLYNGDLYDYELYGYTIVISNYDIVDTSVRFDILSKTGIVIGFKNIMKQIFNTGNKEVEIVYILQYSIIYNSKLVSRNIVTKFANVMKKLFENPRKIVE